MKELDKVELIRLYETVKEENKEKSLDELLYQAFKNAKENDTDSFDEFRTLILEANGIDEYAYYTKNVRLEIKRYVEGKIFPEYEKHFVLLWAKKETIEKRDSETSLVNSLVRSEITHLTISDKVKLKIIASKNDIFSLVKDITPISFAANLALISSKLNSDLCSITSRLSSSESI